MNAQQSAAKSRLTNMYKDRLDGVISEKEYSMFRDTLFAEEQDISRRIDELSEQMETLSAKRINAESQRAVIEKYTHFTKLDRTIADEFIDYIEIGEVSNTGERDILIHWKI